jgi:hypothetical protein
VVKIGAAIPSIRAVDGAIVNGGRVGEAICDRLAEGVNIEADAIGGIGNDERLGERGGKDEGLSEGVSKGEVVSIATDNDERVVGGGGVCGGLVCGVVAPGESKDKFSFGCTSLSDEAAIVSVIIPGQSSSQESSYE